MECGEDRALDVWLLPTASHPNSQSGHPRRTPYIQDGPAEFIRPRQALLLDFPTQTLFILPGETPQPPRNPKSPAPLCSEGIRVAAAAHSLGSAAWSEVSHAYEAPRRPGRLLPLSVRR